MMRLDDGLCRLKVYYDVVFVWGRVVWGVCGIIKQMFFQELMPYLSLHQSQFMNTPVELDILLWVVDFCYTMILTSYSMEYLIV